MDLTATFEPQQPLLSRRFLLKAAGLGAATVALAGGSGALLSGCASNEEAASGGPVSGNPDEVVVTMTPGSEPAAGFDPLFSWGCGEHVHEPLIQSTLITTDADLNFVNDLATGYECSPDGMTWTFTIRDDVRFTDGEPLTASDVAFTLNGIIANEAAEADLSMVERAVADSPTVCRICMKKPFNAMLYTLAVVGIVPEHAYDAQTYGANPIGSGRYMLEQWDRGQQVVLAANPDYYGEAPLMKRVVVVFMEEDASLAAAEAAKADVCYVSATTVDAVQPEGFDLLDCRSVDSRGISLPCVAPGGMKKDGAVVYETGNAVTCDESLRRAVNRAVDRQAMVDHVLNGYGTAAYSVSDGTPWYSPDMEVAFDQDSARESLAQGGWEQGEDGVWAKQGVRAAFDLYYAANDSVRQALAHEFANQMAQVGIEVTVKGAGWDDMYPHEYDTPILWGWGSNSPVEVYMLHYGPSAGNYAVCESPVIDDHLDRALACTTVEESYGDWKLAAWDGHDGFAPRGAAPWVWLVNVNHLYFKRTGLQVAKQKPHPHGHGWSLVNNVNEWSWRADDEA